MKKTIIFVFTAVFLLCLSSCHVAPPVGSANANPSTTDSQNAESPTPTTIPTEPTMPKELVSEVREDGLIYEPNVHHKSWAGKFSGMNLRFKLDEGLYPGKVITYDVFTNYGEVRSFTTFYEAPLPLENQKVYFWSAYLLFEDENEILNRDGAVFVDVIIRADGNIIGYGIFEIGGDGNGWFSMMRTETVIFPMFNGQIQDVSEEYVVEKIAELKQTVTPFDLEVKQAEYDAYRKGKKEEQKATEPTQP